jgi:hypothetical protein
VVVRGLRRWWDLTGSERVVIIWSGLLLVFFRAQLLVVPFSSVRATASWLARSRGARRPSAPRTGELVESVARRIPGATCLPIALTGYVVLSRAGWAPVLRIGVARGARSVEAHAWVEVGGVVAVGGTESARFTVVEGKDIMSC